MGYNLNDLKKFDNNLKTLNDRKEFVENLLEDNLEMIADYVENSMLNGESQIEDKPLNITIEQLGTYILRSEGVESSRKGDYSFYESEKRYRQYAIGKASIATDVSSRDDICKEHYDKYETDDSSKISLNSLFNFDNMSPEEKKNLIKIGLKEKDNQYSELKNIMSSAYDYIMDMLTDEKDRIIVNMLVEGKIECEISDVIGIARQNVNKRLKRICENKI